MSLAYSLIQYSDPNNKIYNITNVKLTTAQFPNPNWRPRECSTQADRLLLSRCPSIVNCYAHCPQSRQRLASTDFCVEKSQNLNFRAFKSIKISPCFPILSVWLYETLSIPGLLRFAGRSWTRIAVAAPQISWYDFFHSLQLDQFICNVRMALAYYNCLILIKQYVYTLHVYMWCVTERILHSMSV